ncbi:pseudo-response regulator 5 [Striga asiatica]|uniref:Pseudo-response regulator 5 n=1 Tax=Striga asiatica TaxID=4170 RepID=A0A5A7PHZ0_STRAF|nr:pseudo-response regulator 5 [Striga asiatica]
MDEVGLTTENGMRLEIHETGSAGIMGGNTNSTADGGAAAEAAAGNLGWERLLRKLSMRVLLVEADNSTRQIIGALLRKCSFKVASVSDGLKAWELIKGRPHKIDLILSEVELPSISGYALLTLIMEHDICKNIPVIMMSSHDSISTVYKCMLRGSADFLVKPIRRNELSNLWHHVWRKQHLSASGSVQKVEATAENNGVSNRSNDSTACLEKNLECIERVSDAQSSCAKPELETERPDNDLPVNVGFSCFKTDNADQKSSREAIDLIGVFDKLEELPPLDLSLRRSHPSCSVNQGYDETPRLKHSDASAFSRSMSLFISIIKQVSYINRTVQPRNSIFTSSCNEQKEHKGEISPPIPVKGIRIRNIINNGIVMSQSSLHNPAKASNLQFCPQLQHFYSPKEKFLSNFNESNLNMNDGLVWEGVPCQSMQRQAALKKFRQKRKDRCFEKKVRYESRKKLAEQRPRVKGQFVRQATDNPHHVVHQN